MPVPGEAVRGIVRDVGKSFIGRVAASGERAAAAAAGDVANAHALKVSVLPMSTENMTAFNAFLRKPIVWANDMNCFAKASVSARHINMVGGRGLTPAETAMDAAIAILPAPPSARNWSFHAGVVVRDESSGLHVIDHLTSARPMPFERWARTYGVKPEDARIVSPFAGTAGVKGTMTDEATWKWIGSALQDTWDGARKYRVQVGG